MPRRSRLPIREFEVDSTRCLHDPAVLSSLLDLSDREVRSLRGAALAGVLDGAERTIYVDRCLGDHERAYTEIHELVHARRQLGGEEHGDPDTEEEIVELETVARARTGTLRGVFPGRLLTLLRAFLTDRGRLRADRRRDLEEIHARIGALRALLRA